MDFPTCQQRKVLVQTEAGPRVHLSLLHGTFSPSERSRWYRQSISYPSDAFGMLPELVEKFLEPRQVEMF